MTIEEVQSWVDTMMDAAGVKLIFIFMKKFSWSQNTEVIFV